jgi:hypothetical protein
MGYATGVINRRTGRGHYLFKHDGTNLNKLNAIGSGNKKIIATTDKSLKIVDTTKGSAPSEDDGKHYNNLLQIPQSFVEEYVNASGLDKALVKVNTHMDQHPDWRPSYNNPDNSGGEAIIYHLPEVDDNNTISITIEEEINIGYTDMNKHSVTIKENYPEKNNIQYI